MPELPEVETVRQGLARWVTGRRIAAVEVLPSRAPYAGTRPAAGTSPPCWPAGRARTCAGAASTCGCRWTAATRVVGHLGMSGQLLLQPADAPTRRTCGSGSGSPTAARELRFVDQRTFGGLSVSRRAAPELPAEIAHIARDPIDPAFADAAFVAALRRRRTEVKRALLDQTLISGVGNIYADEALWRAELHGARPTDALTGPAARRLLGHVRDVLGEAIEPGRHQLRRALRQRQRRERLLRPVAERLRAGGASRAPAAARRSGASRS